jgi:hypothetical protein
MAWVSLFGVVALGALLTGGLMLTPDSDSLPDVPKPPGVSG